MIVKANHIDLAVGPKLTPQANALTSSIETKNLLNYNLMASNSLIKKDLNERKHIHQLNPPSSFSPTCNTYLE